MQPRARGAVEVSAKRLGARSVIDELYQAGSMRCLFPKPGDPGLDAVLLNTAGGVTGGDAFTARARAGQGSTLTLTTQACERAYKARPGETGRVTTDLQVGAQARLNWLPQETLIFDGAALKRRLTVELDESAALLLCEPLVFGREAMGERVTSAALRDRIEIRRARVPVYLDAIGLEGDLSAQLADPATAAGAHALATVVFAHPGAEAMLGKVRALLPEAGGASLLLPDLLVARLLARDAFDLRQSLVPIVRVLNNDLIPRCWMT